MCLSVFVTVILGICGVLVLLANMSAANEGLLEHIADELGTRAGAAGDK